MKHIFYIALFLFSYVGFAGARAKVVYSVSNGRELDSILSIPVDSIYILLLKGDFILKPHQDIDTSFITKKNRPVAVHYTYGIKVTGKFVSITGAPNYGSMIFTHSGYGIYFDRCQKAIISGVIITAGARDPDSLATDAAIVVRNSTVDIFNDIIFDNIGDSASVSKTHQGIMGICCRGNSYAFIHHNQIARNSWDGISIYKNGHADISENLIDGVETYEESFILTRYYVAKAEKFTKGGCGTGIFLTRNAYASIRSNIIKRYARGICVYVNANADISNNVIEDIKQWGICAWDADTGRPVVQISGNVIYKTGACGVGLTRYREPKNEGPGYMINNIIVETAKDRRYDSPDKFCFQCALAVHAVPDSFIIANNIFYENQWLSPCSSDHDLMLPQFTGLLQRNFPLLAENWFAGYSEFIQRFYDRANKPIEKTVAKSGGKDDLSKPKMTKN